MANKKKTSEFALSNVTYVKLSPYYCAFLHSLYGKPVVRLPVASALYAAFERGLICNSAMRQLSALACCSSLFMLKTAQHPEVTDEISDVRILPDESKGDFIAIEMPDIVVRPPSVYYTGSFWQLSYKGASNFRKAVKTEFWIECFRFVKSCYTDAAIKGYQPSIENAISDFMMAYNISMDLFENMLRYYRRAKIDMQAHIAKERERMEAINGVPLCYT